MRDVRDQPPLSLHRSVDAREHPVHGRGQAADLVASTIVGDPEGELVVADRIDLCADVVEPRQCPAEDQPDHEGERHQDQRATDHEGSPQSACGLVHGLETGADDDDHLAVRRLTVLEPDPVGLGLVVVRGADGAARPVAHAGIDDRRLALDVRRRGQDGAVGSDHLRNAVVVHVAQDRRELAGAGLVNEVACP